MALLLNESEQLAVLLEVISVQGEWVFSHIAFQHYLPNENDFATWVEAYVDVYETDLRCLVYEIVNFAKDVSTARKFAFEPQAEPSFEFRFQIGSVQPGPEVLVSVALDIKRILNLSMVAAYRENRISLQFLTDRVRVRRFSEQISLEVAKFVRLQ